MNPCEEFLRHAADCEEMAKATGDAASRLTWNRMAERWRMCAWKIESRVAHHKAPATRNRRALPRGAFAGRKIGRRLSRWEPGIE